MYRCGGCIYDMHCVRLLSRLLILLYVMEDWGEAWLYNSMTSFCRKVVKSFVLNCKSCKKNNLYKHKSYSRYGHRELHNYSIDKQINCLVSNDFFISRCQDIITATFISPHARALLLLVPGQSIFIIHHIVYLSSRSPAGRSSTLHRDD